MSVRSQIEGMNSVLLEAGSAFATPVTIDSTPVLGGGGKIWSGNGLYFHFEQGVNANGMPVMELSSTVIVRISTVAGFFGGPPAQRWKITAVDITGATVTGYINEVTPDLDLGQYLIKFGNP